MIQIFTNNNFGQVEVINHNGVDLFNAVQIAIGIGYKNERDAILRLCKHVVVIDGKKYINESDLYRLISKSRLKKAKEFEAWIYEEILPSLRKYGVYMTDKALEQTLNDKQFLLELVNKLREEKQERRKLQDSLNTNKEFYEIGKFISGTDECISVGDFAKILRSNDIFIGRNRLYRYLRNEGYLISSGDDRNSPKQRYMEMGLFKLKESIYYKDNEPKIRVSPLITGKGQRYFIDKLYKDYYN